MTSEICMNKTVRTLEEKISICINEPCFEESYKNFDLEYYLLEGEYAGREDELEGSRVFGIEVVKKVKDIILEKEAVIDFSSSKARTIQALKLLGESKVTPITFKDILEDILVE